MTPAEIAAERDYRYWERIGHLCADGPVPKWAEQIAREEADEWAGRQETVEAFRNETILSGR